MTLGALAIEQRRRIGRASCEVNARCPNHLVCHHHGKGGKKNQEKYPRLESSYHAWPPLNHLHESNFYILDRVCLSRFAQESEPGAIATGSQLSILARGINYDPGRYRSRF